MDSTTSSGNNRGKVKMTFLLACLVVAWSCQSVEDKSARVVQFSMPDMEQIASRNGLASVHITVDAERAIAEKLIVNLYGDTEISSFDQFMSIVFVCTWDLRWNDGIWKLTPMEMSRWRIVYDTRRGSGASAPGDNRIFPTCKSPSCSGVPMRLLH